MAGTSLCWCSVAWYQLTNRNGGNRYASCVDTTIVVCVMLSYLTMETLLLNTPLPQLCLLIENDPSERYQLAQYHGTR